MELVAAVAPAGAENIAGKAFGMDSHQHFVFGLDLSFHQGKMHLVVDRIGIGNRLNVPKSVGICTEADCFTKRSVRMR